MTPRYDPAAHDVGTFDCGEDALSRWLRIGPLLLRDALTRVLAAAEQVAIRAVAYAIGEQAAAFYVRFGFEPLADEPRTLMITLDELRRSRERLIDASAGKVAAAGANGTLCEPAPELDAMLRTLMHPVQREARRRVARPMLDLAGRPEHSTHDFLERLDLPGTSTTPRRASRPSARRQGRIASASVCAGRTTLKWRWSSVATLGSPSISVAAMTVASTRPSGRSR